MKISELFKKEKKTFSFEFFPPKDQISAIEFGINAGQLMKLSPSFVSVTYGAGGKTQDRTFELVDFFQNTLGLNTMAHYTCVNASKEKIKQDMEYLKEKNIENLMLLRGDPPEGRENLTPNPDGFDHASDLISFVRKHYDFCIGGAAYPETHVEASSEDEDLQNLKKKIEAGTDFLVTQMFFDNTYFFDFLERARSFGINCPIIPGIIPVTNYKQIKKFADLSGAKIPQSMIDQMEPYQDDPDAMYKIGVEIATKQARELLNQGTDGIHFYTLNKSHAAVEIYEELANEFPEIKKRYEKSFSPHIRY